MTRLNSLVSIQRAGQIIDGVAMRWSSTPDTLCTIVDVAGTEWPCFADECVPVGQPRFDRPALTMAEAVDLRGRIIAGLRWDREQATTKKPRPVVGRPGRGVPAVWQVPTELGTNDPQRIWSSGLYRYLVDRPEWQHALEILRHRHPTYYSVLHESLRPKSGPLKDIAARLGISYAAARKRHSRGLMAWAEIVAEECHNSPVTNPPAENEVGEETHRGECVAIRCSHCQGQLILEPDVDGLFVLFTCLHCARELAHTTPAELHTHFGLTRAAARSVSERPNSCVWRAA